MSEKKPWSKGSYEKVPLRSDSIRVAIVQSRLAIGDPVKNRKENLGHMLQLIDMTQGRDPKDLLAFHEFPLGGCGGQGKRKDCLNAAIKLPGEETDAIGEKAKKYNCYIELGCYATLPEWPNHFHNMGVIIGPNGKVIHTHWKMRNLSGFGFSTTVNDVLDKYVEMYGWDAVFPIAKTDIGNIAIIPEVGEPELGRAYAIKGAEIVIRYMTGGASHWSFHPLAQRGGKHNTFIVDFQGMCIAGHFYGLFVNNAISPREGVMFNQGSGCSMIIDCDGRIMKEVSSFNETVISEAIPMAAYRKVHKIPNWPKDFYMHLYEEYVPKFPANTFLEALPDSMPDGARHYRERANW